MARALYALGRWCYRAGWWVIGLWLALVLAVGAAAFSLQQDFDESFSIPGMPSNRASEMLIENFEGSRNPGNLTDVNIVFQAPEDHTLTEPAMVDAVQKVVDQVADTVPEATKYPTFGNPVTINPKLIDGVIKGSIAEGMPRALAEKNAHTLRILSDDNTIAYTTFQFDAAGMSAVTEEQKDAVKAALETGRQAGLIVEADGPGFAEKITIETLSEVIGVAVAFLVLIVTFGSLVAAGLPLIGAVIGVAIGALGVVMGTAWADLSNVTPVLALMLGLAVGIDYALFILSRYRAEIPKHWSLETAAATAVGTAGSAVVFAGVTVIVALVAMILVHIPFLSYMGLAAAATVGVSVLIALTLTPALLGVLKGRTFAWRIPIPGLGRDRREENVSTEVVGLHARGLAGRYMRALRNQPGWAMLLIVVLVGLSIPAARLDLALPVDATAPHSTTHRRAADLMAEGFGPGKNAPFLVIVDGHGLNTRAPIIQPYVEGAGYAPDDDANIRRTAFQVVAERLSTHADVENAQIVGVNGDSTAAQLLVVPKTGPVDKRTTELLHALRAQSSDLEKALSVEIGITGLAAIQQDVTDKLNDAMPIYLLVVVGLAVVLLLVVFRSLLVPVIAACGFVLSVGAAFGVTVLFWQDGLWGLVETPGPITSFLPIFLIGVTFGLAMDYQVFIVSRMRESYTRMRSRMPNAQLMPRQHVKIVEESTADGFVMGSRVVTAAALIMIAVFVANIGQPLPFVKVFGFALAVAVAVDAFVVRMTLVPATMFLLGRSAWWMPRWLDKLLPRVDVEGHGLEVDGHAGMHVDALTDQHAG